MDYERTSGVFTIDEANELILLEDRLDVLAFDDEFRHATVSWIFSKRSH